jgi:hypothetical protein
MCCQDIRGGGFRFTNDKPEVQTTKAIGVAAAIPTSQDDKLQAHEGIVGDADSRPHGDATAPGCRSAQDKRAEIPGTEGAR